jgi:hypothetical protein
MFGDNEVQLENRIEDLLEIFTLEELLFECELSPVEAVKILYLNGHLDLPNIKPL